MAISRPILLALLGIALLGATVFAVQSTRGDSSSTNSAAPVAESPAPAQAQPAALSPKDALRSATSVDGIKSAHFTGSFAISAKGKDLGKVALAGSFERGGPGDMPKLDVQAKSDGFGSSAQNFDVGFVSTGDKAYIVKDGTGYQLPEEAWRQAIEARKQGSATPIAAIPSIDASAWVKSIKDEGTEDVDGVETQHVAAVLDPTAAVRDLSKLGQGAGGQLPNGAADAIQRADVDVWVGTADKLPRRIWLELAAQGATIRFEAELSQVNDPQTIEAPDKVSDALPAGILGSAAPSFSSGLSLATGADAKALVLPSNNKPQRLARAVAHHREALILFEQPRGLDDKATARAVRAAGRHSKALILTDDVRNTKRYGDLVQDLGVNQAPAIVIVDRDGQAKLIEGYVDAGTLTQELADAR